MRHQYLHRFVKVALIGVLLLCRQVVWAQEKDSLQLTVDKGWIPKKIEDKIIYFDNGKSFDTQLYQMKYLGQLKTKKKAPYLVLGGFQCSECDANYCIFIHSPNDGPILKHHSSPHSYLYPGRLEVVGDVDISDQIYETRTFIGDCLPGRSNAVIWYITKHEQGISENSVLIVYIDELDSLKEIELKSNLPNINITLEMVKANKCHEIEGANFPP